MENAPDMELLPAKLNEQSVLKERKRGREGYRAVSADHKIRRIKCKVEDRTIKKGQIKSKK